MSGLLARKTAGSGCDASDPTPTNTTCENNIRGVKFETERCDLHIIKMSSKRVTLHGVDPNENASPLKHRIGEVTVKDGSSILGDEDYVDVELETVETVITRKPRNKRRKTSNSIVILQSCSSRGYSVDNEDLLPNIGIVECQGSPEHKCETVSHDDHECEMEGNSSVEDHDWHDDVTGDEGDGELKSTTVSNELLEIEAGDGEYHLVWLVVNRPTCKCFFQRAFLFHRYL